MSDDPFRQCRDRAQTAPLTESVVHRFFRRDFPFTLALLVTAIVFYGFSNTAGPRLFHAGSPPPWIMWVHTPLFASWPIILIVQTAPIMALPQPICMTIAFGLTDLVLLLCVLRDVVLDGQVSRIYRIGYPIVVVIQAIAVYLLATTPDWYLAAARWLTGLG